MAKDSSFEQQYALELQALKDRSEDTLRKECAEQIARLKNCTSSLSFESVVRSVRYQYCHDDKFKFKFEFEFYLGCLYLYAHNFASDIEEKLNKKEITGGDLAENLMVLKKTVLLLERKLPVDQYLWLSDHVSGKANKYFEALGALMFVIGCGCYIACPILMGFSHTAYLASLITFSVLLSLGAGLFTLGAASGLSGSMVSISRYAKEVEKLGKQRVNEMRSSIAPETTVKSDDVELTALGRSQSVSPEEEVPVPERSFGPQLIKLDPEENVVSSKIPKSDDSSWMRFLWPKTPQRSKTYSVQKGEKDPFFANPLEVYANNTL